MSIQLIWKRSSHHLSMPMFLLRPLALPHIKFPNYCTQRKIPSTTPPDRGVASDFFINKCGLTDEDVTRVFRYRNGFFKKSTKNFEEVLEILNGLGLTTPAQIRRVTLRNPSIFFLKPETNLKAKLSFLGTFMKEEDVSKLVYADPAFFSRKEGRIKSAISLLQRLGREGQELSELLVKQPLFLTASEENVIDTFKRAESLGFKKESKMFARALCSIVGLRKEIFDRRLRHLSSLGFSEEQVLILVRREPAVLRYSEETLKRRVDFLVKSAGLPLAELIKYPTVLGLSLVTRMFPRFRVMEALKSMQGQVLKRETTFPRIAMLTEKCFLEKYVDSNAESSNLRDIYHSAKLESLLLTRSRAVSNSL